MRFILLSFLIFQISGIASAKMNFTIGPAGKAEQKVWRSSDNKISFNYPSDWGPEKPGKDGGVQLYKAGKGWFELSLIKIPEGETLEGFSKHIIEKSKGSDWDLRLEKDLGKESIGDKMAWVHKYRHKKKSRIYYGYHFISKNNTGIRILMVKISPEGEKIMMAMLNSLNFPQHLAETVTDIKKPVDQITGKHTSFGTYQSHGSVRGYVRLKNSKDKTAYPCYMSFQPVQQVKGRKQSKNRGDYKPTGEAVLTATDNKGRYNADLDEGIYFVEIYKSDGQNWPVLKGDIFHRSKAKKVHNCQIDNR